MAVVHLCGLAARYAYLLRIIYHFNNFTGKWREELTPDEFAFALFPVSAFGASGAIVSRRTTVAGGTYLV
jgi:hypothetical protein